MTIGISTYAFMWRMSERMPRPMSLDDVLAETARLGLHTLQICDVPAVAEYTRAQLHALRDKSDGLGIGLELGTRGVDPEHLHRFRVIASELGAPLLRSMIRPENTGGGLWQAEQHLRAALPDFERHGVTLALETYEQVPTTALAALTARIDSARMGICLDAGNMVAALETPEVITALAAPRVVNWHIKDFGYERREDSVGFVVTGRPLGKGLFDYASAARIIEPNRRRITQVIELWLPWLGEAAHTAHCEARWTEHAVDYLACRQDVTP